MGGIASPNRLSEPSGPCSRCGVELTRKPGLCDTPWPLFGSESTVYNSAHHSQLGRRWLHPLSCDKVSRPTSQPGVSLP